MYFVLELEALLFSSPQWDDFCLKGTFILTVTTLFKNANISFYWVTTDWGSCREEKVTVDGWSGKASRRRRCLVGLGRDDSLMKWKPGRREGNRQETGRLVTNTLGVTEDRARGWSHRSVGVLWEVRLERQMEHRPDGSVTWKMGPQPTSRPVQIKVGNGWWVSGTALAQCTSTVNVPLKKYQPGFGLDSFCEDCEKMSLFLSVH